MATTNTIAYPVKCPACGTGNQSTAGYCRSCAHELKAHRQARIIRYHVSFYLDDQRFKLDQTFADYSDALTTAITWIDCGPVGRSREARIFRTVNDQRDASFSETKRYDNYKQRRKSIKVDGYCDTCKGKGKVKIKPASVRVACRHCLGTGQVTTSISDPVIEEINGQAKVVGTAMTRPPVIQPCDRCHGVGSRPSSSGGKTVDVMCPTCSGMQRNRSKKTSWARRFAA